MAADEEAAELIEAAGGDEACLADLVDRRLAGEPLAWITGVTAFCGRAVRVGPGVYVPRWQSEVLAERAAALLGPAGRALDLGTGSGALARVLMDRRPGAAVIGVDVDPCAAVWAARNGVPAIVADLFEAIGPAWLDTLDVVVAVLPYVPTAALAYLPRDVIRFEPARALDGGEDGLGLVRRIVAEAPRWLRPGGSLLLELGGDQHERVVADLEAAGLEHVAVLADPDGDPRGVEARRGAQAGALSSSARRPTRW